MFCPCKIYFVGTHCTGKTTLCKWTAKTYGLPIINETARAELGKLEITLSMIRSDIDCVSQYQEAVLRRQILEESQLTHFVSDRAFDALAYTAEHASNYQTLYDIAKRYYFDTLKQPNVIVFFVRPHKVFLDSAKDDVRERLDWDAMLRIDGMLKLLLIQEGINYKLLCDPSMQERTRAIQQAVTPYMTP